MRLIKSLFLLFLVGSLNAQEVAEEVIEFVMSTAGSQENVVPVLDSLIESTDEDNIKYPYYRYLRLEFEREPYRLSTRISDLEYAIKYTDSTNTFFGDTIQDSTNFSSLYNLVGIHKKYSGDIEGAVVAFNKGLRINPNDELIYLNLASAYGHQNKWNQAYNTINKYKSSDTLFSYFYIRTAYFFQQNQLKLAENEIQKCLKQNNAGKDLDIQILASELYLELKNNEKACYYLQKAKDAYFELSDSIEEVSYNTEWKYWVNHIEGKKNKIDQLKEKYCDSYETDN